MQGVDLRKVEWGFDADKLSFKHAWRKRHHHAAICWRTSSRPEKCARLTSPGNWGVNRQLVNTWLFSKRQCVPTCENALMIVELPCAEKDDGLSDAKDNEKVAREIVDGARCLHFLRRRG